MESPIHVYAELCMLTIPVLATKLITIKWKQQQYQQLHQTNRAGY